ncbi:MAG: hypothetical protein MR016_04600 [Agathobacter sp.]|nr:hypothetical protein [Agathobacter sp.]
MDREALINQLQSSFAKDNLPDVDMESKMSVLQTDTQTLVCLNGVTSQSTDVEQAIEYFMRAEIKLKKSLDEDSQKKALYCKLAYSALTEVMKDHK